MRGPRNFRRVLRSGRRRRVGGVTVAALRRPDEAPPTVGLVVGRSVGGAVVRNRVRRRLRHALRQVGLEAGTDYVVIATPVVAEVEFERLVRWLRRATDELREEE